MIDFAGLVGRITGKATGQADAAMGAEAGVATGGAFAELVRLATQGEAKPGQGNLRLVVDNPDIAGIAPAALVQGAEGDPTTGGDIVPMPAVDGDDNETDEGSLSVADPLQPNPCITVANPAAAAPAVVLMAAVANAPEVVSATDAVSKPGSVSAPVGTTLGGQRPLATNEPAVAVLARSDQPVALVQAVPVPQEAAGDGMTPQAPLAHDGAQKAGVAHSLAAADTPSQARSSMLTAAWRTLAPRQRDASAVMIAPAVTARPDTDAEMDDSTSDLSAAAKAAMPTLSAATAVDRAAPAASPLRAIVDALPPVIQSELGAPVVRAVTGPSTGDALGNQVIDMGVSGQWIDRMAKEIAGLADGSGHSRFTLSPPHLGRLQVDLWRDGGMTNVRMLTETDEATQRLSEGRSALQADARVAALSLGAITVEKAHGSLDSGARDQSGHRPGADAFGQQADGQARAGGGQAQGQGAGQGNGQQQGSDRISRIARNDSNRQDDASSRTPGRAADGHVRFA